MQTSRRKRSTVLLLLAAMLCQGCVGPGARLQYLIEDQQALSHYEDLATAIEYPIEEDPRETDPNLFLAPRSIRDLSEVKHRAMTLDECVRLAIAKTAIMRDDASFGSPVNPLLANPGRVSSVYDSAIQETNFLFGNRGPEAALSDFDALMTNSMTWGRAEDPQNTQFFNLDQGDTLVEESAQFSSRIEKPFANSGTFSVQQDWNYSANNVTNRLFPSAYTGFLQGEYRQPLLAGSGTEFTRIAGPIGQNLRGVSGVSQGVLISRINSDISQIEFEQSVSTIVRDVQNRYWDLYLALRLYDSEIKTFQDLLVFWRRISIRDDTSSSTADAQARIFEADARLKGSLADVLDAEARLRRLMGLPLNDGEFISPADHPSEARLTVNWESTLTEALAHRAELRRQKWEIRSLELQLQAAKNLSRPRLDMVSQYRVNGFGDNLLGHEDDDGTTDQGYASAYESMTQGLNTTWNLGLSFSMPLGLRLARTGTRNFELRLVKARAVLSEQEREIAYELNTAMLNMERWYELADSSTKRMNVAVSNVGIQEGRLDRRVADPDTVNNSLRGILDAKNSQRDAEQAYLRSIVEYNKAIVDLNYRKGMALQSQSIYLAEGEWNPGAYEEARKRAEATTAAIDNPFLHTEPMEFVGGPAPTAWESLGIVNRPHVAIQDPNAPPETATPLIIPSTVPDVPAKGSLTPADPSGSQPAPVPPGSPFGTPAPEMAPAPEGDPVFPTPTQPEQPTQPDEQPVQPEVPVQKDDQITSRLPAETAARVPFPSRPKRTGWGASRITRLAGLQKPADPPSETVSPASAEQKPLPSADEPLPAAP